MALNTPQHTGTTTPQGNSNNSPTAQTPELADGVNTSEILVNNPAEVENIQEESTADTELVTVEQQEEVNQEEHQEPAHEILEEEAQQQLNTHPMMTRAKDGIHQPNPRYALLASIFHTEEPKSLEAAMKHPGWNQAVMDEMGRIHMLHTWSLVPPTEDMNILDSRWVFKTKLKPDGSIDKLKARLVAKGFNQEEGLDYLETFSPVVRTSTIRIVLEVATAKDWIIKQLDVSNAFLHGELQEPVFMSQPTGFTDPKKPNHVCRLTTALYGLKQAPRAWFDTFSNFLIEFGFNCSKSDPSLFTYYKDGKALVLLLYVDDMLLTGSDQELLSQLLEALNKRFSMKVLGKPKYFMGIEIETLTQGLFLHQSAYAADILHQALMSNCNPMPTSLPQQLEYEESELFSEPTYFRSLAEKLQYLTITRPDIQFAVNFIC